MRIVTLGSAVLSAAVLIVVGAALRAEHRDHQVQVQACEAAFSGPARDDGITREILLSPACAPLTDDELSDVLGRWNIRRLTEQEQP